MATNAKRKNINITTPEGTFKYPHLTVADTKYNPAGEYTLKLVLSEDDAAPLIAQMKTVAKEAFNEAKAQLENAVANEKGDKKAKAIAALQKLAPSPLPVKRCYDDDGEQNGNVELTFKMKANRPDPKTPGATVAQRPKIFDAAGKELTNPPQIWSGTTGCAAATLIPFYTAAVGAGVSLRLSAVQIINLVNGNGGGASSFGFAAKSGGYTSEAGSNLEDDSDISFESDSTPVTTDAADEF